MKFDKLPLHIGIVMDGNGRWAKNHGLTRIEGHRKGADTALKIVEYAGQRKIKFLTLYTFSSENWSRPDEEVSGLMGILYENLLRESESLRKNNVKLGTIGDTRKLPQKVQNLLCDVKSLTSKCDGLHLTLALSYGARDEIVRACKKIATKVKNGDIEIGNISEELFSSFLDTKSLPDPDLIIRTSNENRLSNFLLWQSSYAELFFIEKLWPDFTGAEFDRILLEFSKRQRRYGKVSEI